MNVCVLVEYIIVVGDFPAELRFVGVGQDLEEIEPAHLSLEADDILDLFLVIGAEEHCRVVLILHEKLHRWLDQDGGRHHVGLVVRVQVVKEVALIILWDKDGLRGSQNSRFSDIVLRLWEVWASLEWDAVGNFNLKKLDFRLVNCKICHLNIETVEVNAADTFFYVVWKFTLADLV